jgi:hypothetical protein
MDQMVLDVNEDVFLTISADQAPSNQGELRQLKQAVTLLRQELVGYPLAFVAGQMTEILQRKYHAPWIVNFLAGRPFGHVKRRAIDFVPPNDFAETPLQGRNVQRTDKRDGRLEVVGPVSWRQLMDEPDTFL